MAEFVYIGDHEVQAVDVLALQHRRRPRMVAAVQAMADGAQLLEDTIMDLAVGTGLDSATGATLEQWGELVGEERGGLTDTELRNFIRARVLATRTNGTPDDLTQILALITAPSTVSYQELYPCMFAFVVRRDAYLPDTVSCRVGRLMRQIKPAGIGMEIVEAAAGYLGFQGDPLASPFNIGIIARLL